MTHDYLFNSRRLHLGVLVVIIMIAAFLRWYRLDNCTLASADEWLAIGPTFQFLDKFFRNPITAIGYEALAGVPFVEAGRMGPPFDYTRSLVLVWSMPYYALVGLFDFPVSEGWYRFPGTVWALLGLWSTHFFVYQLTQRRIAALFAVALQATALAHLVQSRFLVADGVFMFWFPLAAGFWVKFLRDANPRSRHWAYFFSMCYASSTPEALIGLASIFTLIVFWGWQEGSLSPQKPFAALKELRRIFLAPSMLWLVGFYAFQVLVELKFYFHDRDNLLNHASYLGRFFGRGSGQFGFFPDRVFNWYLYPHISAGLVVAAACSLLLVRAKKWRALLLYGWLWVAFWVLLTLFISNSSSNFTRILHPVLVLGAAGLLAVYDRQPSAAGWLGVGIVAANLYGIATYPLLCPLPEDQNVAQAFGYLVQEHGEEWESTAFYFPSGGLLAYVPDEAYRVPAFKGNYTFEGCEAQTVDAASMEGVRVVLALPPAYDTRQTLNKLLDYALRHECEQQRNAALDDFVREQGFNLVGQVISQDGQIHANIWSDLDIHMGAVSIEEANRLYHEKYSRRSWFSP